MNSQVKTLNHPALLSPVADFLMIGGASLVLFPAFFFFLSGNTDVRNIAWIAFGLSTIVNYPHFMASYQLLYGDKFSEIFKKLKFFIPAIVVPVVLIGYFFVCFYWKSPDLLGYAANAMFFFVGWHYVKQIYGVILVTTIRSGYFLSSKEKLLLRFHMYPLWMVSFINGNLSGATAIFYGINYKTFNLPIYAMTINFAALVLSLGILVGMIFKKWWSERKIPPLSAVAAFSAIYIWHVPLFFHPLFFYLIPLFHSLQYLLVVAKLKKTQIQSHIAEHIQTPRPKLIFFRKFWGFGLLCVITGVLSFLFIPKTLDSLLPYDSSLYGKELFVFYFNIFINIHHYFIDHAIWRKDDPNLRMYVLK